MISTSHLHLSSDIRREFISRFGEEPLLVRSPGRVNLIGEHTDYNNGFVLPAAIDKATIVAISKRDDEELNFFSNDLQVGFSGYLSDIRQSDLQWPDYILGVVQQFREAGLVLSGFNLVFGGDIPMGAGMSSSAALECAVAYALNELFALNLDKLTMVKASQKAENLFVGVNCGIMDQFASMFGKEQHVIRLDCRSLEYEYIPFQMDGFRIVLLDTNVKHSLGSSEYNVRRKQCETGVAMIGQYIPSVKSLRDADIDMLDKYVLSEDITIYQRCRYVVEEKERLLKACEDLERNDMEAFGEKMFQTHHGLSKLYEVSCPELDYLVTQVRDMPAVLGARMMGGGFGGCTINLVKEESVDELITEISKRYLDHTGKLMAAYVIKIGNGTELLPSKVAI